MFFNELDILEGRLEYLYDVVDRFVIVESNITHSGLVKPFNFQNNAERYKKYSDKIIYCPLEISDREYNFDLDPKKLEARTSAQWLVENRQRDYIAEALKNFNPYDIAIISDVDEIPNKQAIKSITKLLNPQCTAISFVQDMFYYNFNQKQVNPWTGTVASTVRFIREKTPQFCRDNRETFFKVTNGGWHLSYWGDVKHIQEKLKSFAHQEVNTAEINNEDYIQRHIDQGQDLFNRDYNQFVQVNINSLNKDIVRIFSKKPSRSNILQHYYESVEGFFRYGDTVFYKEIIDRFNGPAHFVEIGSFKGRSSSFMAVEIANSKKNIIFDCIDTWEGSPEHQAGAENADNDVINNTLYNTFIENMKPVEGYYNAKRMTSVEAAKTYDDNSLDFVFIDADHSYESVKEDIIAWYPKIKPGGIISGHDYHMWAPGVMKTTNELFEFVRTVADCWWHRK
jgi:beta-1,4-mannosyl-glycoprotein beta-1,4-N-acetylglucosaminyltransferase